MHRHLCLSVATEQLVHEAGSVKVRDFDTETELRTYLIGWVLDRARANGGYISYSELRGTDPNLSPPPIPIIDHSRGIRNPKELSSTLSIVSSAQGPPFFGRAYSGELRTMSE